MLGSLDCDETHTGMAHRKLSNLLGEPRSTSSLSVPRPSSPGMTALFPDAPTTAPGDIVPLSSPLTESPLVTVSITSAPLTRSTSPLDNAANAELTAEPVLVAVTPGSPQCTEVLTEQMHSPPALHRNGTDRAPVTEAFATVVEACEPVDDAPVDLAEHSMYC